MSLTPAARPSYAAVLQVPHVRRTFTAAMVGRLSYAVAPLSLMLAVKHASDSYAVAGIVMALFSATSVFLSPVRAALIDRHGPRRALVPMSVAYAALLGLLAALLWRPGLAPPLVLEAAAALAGACCPPLGPTLRAVLGKLATDRAMTQRMYSLDAVVEEVLFLSGPLLVGVLVGLVRPAAGVLLGAVLIVVGTAGFVTSPAMRVMPGSGRGEREPAAGRRVARGLARPVTATAGAGLAVGMLDLLVVAFAEHSGHEAGAAWVLAALSAGSAVGGLLNGAVTWRTAAGTRLALQVLGLGLGLGGAALAPDLFTLAVAVAVAGAFVSPLITTAYLIADEAAAPEARVRAGAWVNTAYNAGFTAGAALAGIVVGRWSTAGCFALAGAMMLLTATVVARGAKRGRDGSPRSVSPDRPVPGSAVGAAD